jgi:hypothetical protein
MTELESTTLLVRYRSHPSVFLASLPDSVVAFKVTELYVIFSPWFTYGITRSISIKDNQGDSFYAYKIKPLRSIEEFDVLNQHICCLVNSEENGSHE